MDIVEIDSRKGSHSKQKTLSVAVAISELL